MLVVVWKLLDIHTMADMRQYNFAEIAKVLGHDLKKSLPEYHQVTSTKTFVSSILSFRS